MRAKHGPEHVRHNFWCALADWLDNEAQAAEAIPAGSPVLGPLIRHALAVARAYPGSPDA
jgi:hypothetical protein